MKDKDKTHAQLIEELAAIRQRIAELETLETEHQRTAEALRQCHADLEVSYEELETFAHTLSQDLRGAMGLMISYAQVLAEYHAALTGEELRCYLNTIAQRGHRVIKVIDELLETPTGPTAELEVELSPLDMASIVEQALEIVAFLVNERHAQIILPERWPVALGYAPWVEEVWVNYLSNAIKYGGRPPRVELGASPLSIPPSGGEGPPFTSPPAGGIEGGMVRFWIRDNGPGLTPEEQARLFTPFARPDQVETTGSGLGLAIVRRIVEKLGGQVGIENDGVPFDGAHSRPGHGSLFYFTLPSPE